MDTSASYRAIETMLQQGQLTLSFTELAEYLDMFEENQLISSSEHDAWLELAKKLSADKSPGA